MRTFAFVLFASLLVPFSMLSAQERPLAPVRVALNDPQPTMVTLQDAPHRSPVLAGTLSFLVPFGTGSFYAGNVTHGAIHAAIGVATASLFFATFCMDSCTSGEETASGIGFFGFAANWIASTVVAVLDAKAYNRRHRDPAVRVSFVPQQDGFAVGMRIAF